ncbi:hypothetical protein Daus18300_006038 [Diaporthe australafricana]|uniref:Zn(2)-C6 fungal-type domain-containing protein n=1 Tax=Diaporthe australafricana TaxID=127596 RepID=A0ABR3WX74_9PEZI
MPPNHVLILPAPAPALCPTPALLVASSSTPSSSSSPSLPPRRSAVLAACEACRVKKAKCDGRRPNCGRCERHSPKAACEYRTNEGETHAVALKRRGKTSEEELAQMHELFDFIHNRSEADAFEIFKRMRLSKDPFVVFQSVKDADLVLPNPSLWPITSDLDDPRVHKLNEESWSKSPFKIPARPWTAVAGDGVVSELVYGLLSWDAYLFPCFHADTFLADIRRRDPNTAQYCSPFLINAICAYRSFFSSSARRLGTILGCDMVERFMDEAKKLFELECGRTSLPTVLGLYALFFASAMMGKDRAGMMYRYTAQHMLKQLRLDRRFDQLDETQPDQALEREMISRALWGLFTAESIVSFVYLQPSLSGPPTVPRIFPSISEMQDQGDELNNVDVLGRVFDPLASHPPPLVPASFDAQCHLSDMLYEVMEYNEKALAEDKIGTLNDLRKRRASYVRLMTWKASLPPCLRIENRSPQTSYLRLSINEVAYGIVRPLPQGTRFGDRGTVTDLLLQHCKNDLEVSEAHTRLYSPEFSGFFFNGLYNIIITLASLLHEPRSHNLFARACGLQRSAVQHFPLVKFVLKGAHALVLSLGQDIPPSTRWCFENLEFTEGDLKDVPVSYAVPLHEEMRKLLLTNGDGAYTAEDRDVGTQMQLGALISKWNGMSMP